MLPNVQKQLFEHIFNSFRLMILDDSSAFSEGEETFFSLTCYSKVLSAESASSCRNMCTHKHTHQKHFKTQISMIIGDRWADFTWYAGCCSAVMRTHPAELGAFQLWHLVFFLVFFLILFKWPQAHKMCLLPLPNHTCLTTEQETTHCQFKHQIPVSWCFFKGLTWLNPK